MEIVVAGAGAGKTTKMASKIVAYAESQPAKKMIFCLAFTNNAVDRIKSMLQSHYGKLPSNMHVQTIHSFLIQEFISPYYYIMYGIHYEKYSSINLPDNNSFKNKKISELEKKGILHVSVVPQRAKWIVDKKSGDKKRHKTIRRKILESFSTYCSGIFIDEAQDINSDMARILSILDEFKIPLFLMGDPKQDVKGYGSFRELIKDMPGINYVEECHRCPKLHIKISNSIVASKEKQKSLKEGGTFEVCYENAFDRYSEYGLIYISKKTDKYDTHGNEDSSNYRLESLEHELKDFFLDKFPSTSKETICCISYYYAEKMLLRIDNGEAVNSVVNAFAKIFGKLDRTTYAKLSQALKPLDSATELISVHSIESIKGQEAEKCLFILTTDLAPYLFGKKSDDNKTKNLLYVALTRSLSHLTILVTEEVESKYGKTNIDQFFEDLIYKE